MGDIVVFNPTQTLKQQNFHDPFIKRVIGFLTKLIAIASCKNLVISLAANENYFHLYEAMKAESYICRPHR
jgi:signal peptidase I